MYKPRALMNKKTNHGIKFEVQKDERVTSHLVADPKE